MPSRFTNVMRWSSGARSVIVAEKLFGVVFRVQCEFLEFNHILCEGVTLST
jgi:hypothetical protein